MKLNPDCVRDILLTVEETCTFSTNLQYNCESCTFPRLAKYTHEELIYHIQQADWSNLLTGVHYYEAGGCSTISDLSPEGHDFLANIRNDDIFAKVKSVGKELGIVSLKSIMQIATSTAVVNIKNHFNL